MSDLPMGATGAPYMAQAKGFIREIFENWPESMPDEFEFQDIATKWFILVQKTPKPTKPCGECCNCADYYDADEFSEGVECYRLAHWLE